MFSVEGLIKKHTDKILNVLIIIVALFFANNIYKKQMQNITLLNEKKESELEKNKVLESIGQLEQNYNLIKNAVNKKDVSLAIDKLGNMAKMTNVKIISIKPEKEEDYPAYVKHPFVLTATADNYHAIGKFISAVESSPDVYILESISIKPVVTKQVSRPDRLDIDLRISTILLKN